VFFCQDEWVFYPVFPLGVFATRLVPAMFFGLDTQPVGASLLAKAAARYKVNANKKPRTANRAGLWVPPGRP
jgi:multisubunit Na+/H+ antiporter MnhG subunit